MTLFAPHAADFYKTGHIKQYPEGTSFVYSNFTCRSDKWANVLPDFDHKVVFFGLQGLCQSLLVDLWNDTFFKQPLSVVIRKIERRMTNALGPNAVDLEPWKALHKLGYLPIEIRALPEGSRVDIRVPLFTVMNTLPEFFWLTNYIETQLSAGIWHAITTATTAYEYKRLLTKFAVETGSPIDFVQWQGHDFSFRGLDLLAAGSIQAGHLLSFFGTDTITALDYLEDYYGGEETFLGGSVPATEHSVMCMGMMDDEIETFRRLIQDVYPAGIVSIVSDTWDFWKVLTEYTVTLKDIILNRKPDALGNAKVVFRPDSGDPVEIICGIEIPKFMTLDDAVETTQDHVWNEASSECSGAYNCGDNEYTKIVNVDGVYHELTFNVNYNRHDKTYYYVDSVNCIKNKIVTLSPEQKGAVECLWDVFGGTITDKGYKVLDSHVGLIYGDSITLQRAVEILTRLRDKGFASCNIVFGIGSHTYQMVTRDTFGSAMKATFGIVNDEERVLFKQPKTDSGVKTSARGLLRIEQESGNFVLHELQTWEQENEGLLATVFVDSRMERFQTVEQIRNILNK